MHVYIRPTQRFLPCQVCGGASFERREVKLSGGFSLFDREGPYPAVEGAACTRCGYLHTFVSPAGVPAHQWLDADQVQPGDLPEDPLA
ncbi:hypothetical protein [Nocardioides sp. YIM 152588]|uniref:hypothetical protein n=1 Tax=Nocardioides sp. YIM 152588 TaxID=3158259 RepID=UPI0032E4030A